MGQVLCPILFSIALAGATLALPVSASPAYPDISSTSEAFWKDVRILSVQCTIEGASARQRTALCERLTAAVAYNAPSGIVITRAQGRNTGQTILFLTGQIEGASADPVFAGTIQVKHFTDRARSTRSIRHSAAIPIKLVWPKPEYKRKTPRRDGAIYAALRHLLPWRTLQAAPSSPPRQY